MPTFKNSFKLKDIMKLTGKTTSRCTLPFVLPLLLATCALFPLRCLSQPWQEKAVAAVLMAEAANQGHIGMVAVGEVISRRCAEKSKTPIQVITQRAAFSSLNGTTLEALVRKQRQQPGYAQALKIAALVCRSPGQLPGVTKGATHFVRTDVKPKWARNQKPVAVIRAHAFYRLARY